jgi:voltage-gated potassium channel
MAGAAHVISLKTRLGQQLAVRVNAGALCTHTMGRYKDLLIAELPVRGTDLANHSVRETRLRELYGVNIVAHWERGRLRPARPDVVLNESSIAVVVGTEEQLSALNATFAICQANNNPVIVIGGGKVGQAAIRALKERGIQVTVIEKSETFRAALESLTDRVVIGDAANRQVMQQAGIATAPSVVLTTHDDAANIFLAVYCHRLNPDSHIVSRITHERNLEAIHRAGAAFVLSESGLAAKLLVSVLQNRELVLIGESVEFFVVPVPPSLVGKTLLESDIGARTNMNVIAIRRGDESESSPAASTVLDAQSSLVLIGTLEQRQEFARAFATTQDLGGQAA